MQSLVVLVGTFAWFRFHKGWPTGYSVLAAFCAWALGAILILGYLAAVA